MPNNNKCGDNFGFCLVNSGRYDIWLSNARGNDQSDQHIRLSTHDYEYWNFHLDQIALFDLPAVIEYVQNVTQHKKVSEGFGI